MADFNNPIVTLSDGSQEYVSEYDEAMDIVADRLGFEFAERLNDIVLSLLENYEL